jgi:hypothetical protein
MMVEANNAAAIHHRKWETVWRKGVKLPRGRASQLRFPFCLVKVADA